MRCFLFLCDVKETMWQSFNSQLNKCTCEHRDYMDMACSAPETLVLAFMHVYENIV